MSEKTTRFDIKDHISELTLGGALLALIYCYGNTLAYVSDYWSQPEYSHGYLVPLFAAVLLWMRYEPFPKEKEVINIDRWIGVGVLALSLGLRIFAARSNFKLIDSWTLIPAMLGLVLIVGGRKPLRWAGPAIVFLIFMYPLPSTISREVLGKLQYVATVASTFSLQTMGWEAYNDGNRIMLEELPLGVVDACSGLRMLTIFGALAVALTMVSTDRPWWERLIVGLSAVPIALAVNVFRITITGVLYMYASGEFAEKVFHDFAGWIMMPLALGLLFLEMYILSALFIEEKEERPMSMGLGK